MLLRGSRVLRVLLVLISEVFKSLSSCQHIISQDSTRLLFSPKKIYICVLCTLLLLSSPLVSMATWQGMKDELLAPKFLSALMERLQEVHSSSRYRLVRMLKSAHANLVCVRVLRAGLLDLLKRNEAATD